MATASSRYGANIRLDTRDIARFEKNLSKFKEMTVKKRRDKMASVAKFALGATKKQMIANAKRIKRTGLLAASITSAKYARTGFGSVAGARTGPTIRGKSKKRAHHAHLVELGTRKKMKTAKGSGKFDFYGTKSRKRIRTKRIFHGSKAFPYIAPAWAATKDQVRTRMKKKMAKILRDIRKEFGKK